MPPFLPVLRSVVKEPDNEREACRPSGSTAHDAQRDIEQKAAGRPQHAAQLRQDAAIAAAGGATDGAATPAAPKRRKMLVLPRFVLPSAAHATKTAAEPQPASAASQQAPAPQEQPSAATCKEPAAERPAAAMTPAPAAAAAIRSASGAPATPGKGKQALAGTSTGKKPAAAAAKPANKTPADATRPAGLAGREPAQQCAAAAPAATSAQAEAASADGMPVQKPPGGHKRKLLATATDAKPGEEPDTKSSTSAAAAPRPSPAAPEPAAAAPAGASEPEAANDAEAAGAGARSAAAAGQASQQRSKQCSMQPLQQKPPAAAASAAPAPELLPTRSAVPAKQRAPASKQPPKGSADDGRADNGTPPAKRPQRLPAVLTSTLPTLGELSKGATGSLSARSVIEQLPGMAAPRGPAPGLLSKPALQAMLRQLLPAPAQHQPPAGAGAGAGTNTPAVVLGRTQECQVIDRFLGMGEPERACKAPPQKHSEEFEDAQPGTAAPSAPEADVGAQTADETPQDDTCMLHSIWEIDAKAFPAHDLPLPTSFLQRVCGYAEAH